MGCRAWRPFTSFWIVPAVLIVASTARGQALVASIRSADALLADARYLAGLGATEEQARQIETFVKGVVAGKEQTGLDMGRPLGIYAHWSRGFVAKGFMPIPLVGFLPIKDEKKLLDFLAELGVDVEKNEGGVFRVDPGSGVPMYFRFAQRHVFVALDPVMIRGKLADPATLIPPAAKKNLFYLSLRMDRIPKEEKEQLATHVMKTFMPGGAGDPARLPAETPEEHKARIAELRAGAEMFNWPLLESQVYTVRLDVNRAAQRVVLEAALVPAAGSDLAAGIESLARNPSIFTDMVKDAKLSLIGRLEVSQKHAQGWPDVFNELENVVDPRRRPLMRRVIKTLAPYAEFTIGDFGLAFHAHDGGWTWTAGLLVNNGRKIESLLRDFVKELPAVDRKTYGIKWNHAYHAGTRIHKARIPVIIGVVARSRTVYVAVRNDLVVATTGMGISERPLGEEEDTPALDAVKRALDSIDKPSSSPAFLFRVDMAPGWMASMFAVIGDQLEGKHIPATWHKMIATGNFASPEGDKLGHGLPARVVKVLGKGNLDKVRTTLTVEGGKTLRLILNVHTDTLKLIPILRPGK